MKYLQDSALLEHYKDQYHLNPTKSPEKYSCFCTDLTLQAEAKYDYKSQSVVMALASLSLITLSSEVEWQ